MHLFRRRDRELMGEASIALEWWLSGRPVPSNPPETHWYWRHVLTELRNRSGW